jgi:hypothetical protein
MGGTLSRNSGVMNALWAGLLVSYFDDFWMRAGKCKGMQGKLHKQRYMNPLGLLYKRYYRVLRYTYDPSLIGVSIVSFITMQHLRFSSGSSQAERSLSPQLKGPRNRFSY